MGLMIRAQTPPHLTGELAGSGWQYRGTILRLPRNRDRLELLRHSEPHWWQRW